MTKAPSKQPTPASLPCLPATGGCACGAIRYSIAAQPLMRLICFCRQCQLSGGTGGAPIIIVDDHAVEINGITRFRSYVSDRGTTVDAHFCPNCGSRTHGRSPELAGVTVFRVGCMDEPEWFRPDAYIFTGSAQPWTRYIEGVPQFLGMAPLLFVPE